ncbi:hypothetical protein ACRE_043550 [Hapsidospora chrysogenum ATCC 11550]|uniref:Uncharacterized protein n=1 Tax=Hapsidospora chrysogenum (strain ATCC 11550 / CBS 779.69 / DSM 880 / IAM 14645 / JCM 23072 / IMI 49137) TaxID=857340 RepID=A0A086T6B9_HAPC1|nr:hypothetical protein ACRE_043550 [Hapsidospora chrysogenum ATCC 11550]
MSAAEGRGDDEAPSSLFGASSVAQHITSLIWLPNFFDVSQQALEAGWVGVSTFASGSPR